MFTQVFNSGDLKRLEVSKRSPFPKLSHVPVNFLYIVMQVAANPRNDLKQEATHAAVQRLELTEWVEYANDADWDTKYVIKNNLY